jgi:hypothetical protein
MNESVGVIVGRFQCPDLTAGHRDLIDFALEQGHNQVLIALGCAATPCTKNNPLHFSARVAMIRENYPSFMFMPIHDHPSDKAWSDMLDTSISNFFPYNDNDNDYDLNTVESSSEDSMSDCKPPDPPPPPSAPSTPIDFEKLVRWFNETTGGVFGSVRLPIGEPRKKLLRARIAERGEESFYEVVNNAMNSHFLRGQNNRGWMATFDWLIKPTNYDKVLSNNYKNAEHGTTQSFGSASRKRTSPEQLAQSIASGLGRAEYDEAKREGRTGD